MSTARHTHSMLAAILAAVLPLAACTVDVRDEESGGKAEVDIRTPVGALSVRTDVGAPDTGLRLYPGATPRRDRDDDPQSADVSIGGAWFGVKVVAANFESRDEPGEIVDFYRDEMKAYGAVTECRGDIDHRRGRMVCQEDASSRDIQLAVGTEERQRIVSVKPRGSGSEFALVYIRTGGER